MNISRMLNRINSILDTKTKIQIVGIFVITFIGSCLELMGVAIVLPIIELAMGNESIESNVFARITSIVFRVHEKEKILLLLIATTISIYVFKALFMICLSAIQYRFSMKIKRTLSVRLLESYLSRPYEFFLNSNTADLLRTVSLDTDQFYQVIINVLMITSNGITAFAIGIYLMITNIGIALFIICLLILCAGLIFLFLNKKYRQYGELNHEYAAIINKALLQVFNGVKEIKIIGNEKYFIDVYSDNYKKQAKFNTKFQIFNSLPKQLTEVVCISGILLYMAYSIIFSGNYARLISQIAVFCVGAYKLLPSINAIIAYSSTVLYNKAAIDCIYEDINRAEEYKKSLPSKQYYYEGRELNLNDKIEAKDIVFKYQNSSKLVINKANIVIRKGESVGLMGTSGGGKTTLVDIIIGLLEPKQGSICIDGVDIRQYRGNLGKLIGYIPQNIYLTDDTIRRNIAFGIDDKDIEDEKVWTAIDNAKLREFIETLPDNIYTEVGERGTRLSGGQRQRIGIARALYRNPDILVLDEATSALDTETETEVMKAVNGLKGDKTIIMIAHRISTIKNCDTVYEMKKGKLYKKDIDSL